MSLRVWLPLTKDLRNQGLSEVTVTNNGATFDSNGKLGGCYSFDGSNDFISLNSTALYSIIKGGSIPFSVTMWTYHADSTRAILFGDYQLSGAINFNIELTADHKPRFYWGGSDTICSTAMEANKWMHLAFVYDTTQILFYIDGELEYTRTIALNTLTKSSGDFYLGRDSRTGATTLNGKLSDFRIYNHALSPMEVKQISQGLVLHYPLDNNGFGGENIVPQTGELTLWTKENNVTCIQDREWFTITDVDERAARWGIYKNDIAIEPNTDYTLQIECIGNTNVQLCTNSSLASKIQPISNFSGKKITTFNTAELFGTDATCYMRIYIWPTYSNNHVSKIKHLKIEKGLKPTPWCPNKNDELATIMGMNDGIEYDCSGFGNNGSRNKTFTWTSDTPKYNVSQVFNNNHLIEADGLPVETATIACWIKWNNIPSGNTIPIHDRQSGLAIGLTGGTRLISYVGTTTGGIGSCVNVSLEINTWYHIAVIKTGATTRKVYINGEEITSMASNNWWGGDLDKFFVGGRHVSGSYFSYINGQVCDVRVYVTALSADDVKSLYQNSAYIDSSGNVYGAVHEEV